MGTRNDDISLILAKAKKQGFLPDVKDEEVDILQAEAKKLFGSDTGLGSLAARIKSYNPTLHAAPPTVTHSSASIYWNANVFGANSDSVTLLGTRGLFDSTTGKTFTSPSSVGVEFYLTGDEVEVIWVCESANNERFWLFVDDMPTTAAPVAVSPLVTVVGESYTTKLVFSSVGRRKITLYAGLINAFVSICTKTTAIIEPVPARRPVIAFIGDSFFGGNASIPNPINCAPFKTALYLGAECVQDGIGGSGYVQGGNTNGFGADSRVAAVAKTNPDLIVIAGSTNDDGASGIKETAKETFAKYAKACPNAPVIVFGSQPVNATDTLSSNKANNIAAVKSAASESSNVLAFFDKVGTAEGVPSAWSSAATYVEGALVAYQGAVYKWKNAGVAGNADNPRTQTRWELITWGYMGTGKVGTVTGDGTRDVFLSSDGIHPTELAANEDANKMATAIQKIISF